MKFNYQYILDKSSKKYYCPNCKKKTFVRFVDAQTESFLNFIDGRCDRESKCGYFKKPYKNIIVELRPTSGLGINKQPTYHNSDVIHQYCNNYGQNNFINYLLKHFTPIDVRYAIKKYFLGTTSHWSGATIFWQIDQYIQVKAGKIMLYNCKTGKRVKKPYNHIGWMHKKLKLNKYVLQQCLFGLHNLCDYKIGNTICIVESEKTAVIMSIIFPSNLWLATGSKSNFKEEMLQPIKQYNIIAYPDKSEFGNWEIKAEVLNKIGYRIVCSNIIKNTKIKLGADLIDFISI